MNPTNKVQTRQTFEEIAKERRWTIENMRLRREAYEAALDSVILPEGNGFDIGQRILRYEAGETWVMGICLFLPDSISWQSFTEDQRAALSVKSTDKFRPIPQTVELTDDEKLDAVEKAMAAKSEDSRISVVRDLAKKLTHKTLDQLCAEYNVPTTRELP
jgi:hypothetical protein